MREKKLYIFHENIFQFIEHVIKHVYKICGHCTQIEPINTIK